MDQIHNFLDLYLNEILVGVIMSGILGVVGIIKSFFAGIKKMSNRIDQLETDLENNTRSDEQLAKYIDILIEQKLKK